MSLSNYDALHKVLNVNIPLTVYQPINYKGFCPHLSFFVGAKIKRLPRLMFHMKPERRGATRYNFGAIAEVIDLDEPDELVSITRDLSLSGCFVKTTTPFPKGTRVRVRITHSGADFTALGNVTDNVTSTGMGIAFTQVEPNDRAILERWLG